MQATCARCLAVGATWVCSCGTIYCDECKRNTACRFSRIGTEAPGGPSGLTEGRKNDSFGQPGQKARYDLLPLACLNEVVEVLTLGAIKYGEANWAKVDNHVPRYFSAAMRHLVKWMTGEKIDPESGKSHLAHAIASLLFLMARDS